MSLLNPNILIENINKHRTDDILPIRLGLETCLLPSVEKDNELLIEKLHRYPWAWKEILRNYLFHTATSEKNKEKIWAGIFDFLTEFSTKNIKASSTYKIFNGPNTIGNIIYEETDEYEESFRDNKYIDCIGHIEKIKLYLDKEIYIIRDNEKLTIPECRITICRRGTYDYAEYFNVKTERTDEIISYDALFWQRLIETDLTKELPTEWFYTQP